MQRAQELKSAQVAAVSCGAKGAEEETSRAVVVVAQKHQKKAASAPPLLLENLQDC